MLREFRPYIILRLGPLCHCLLSDSPNIPSQKSVLLEFLLQNSPCSEFSVVSFRPLVFYDHVPYAVPFLHGELSICGRRPTLLCVSFFVSRRCPTARCRFPYHSFGAPKVSIAASSLRTFICSDSGSVASRFASKSVVSVSSRQIFVLANILS